MKKGPQDPLARRHTTVAHPSLPTEGFCAVMTCAADDAACPLAPEADARFSLPYDDPKVAHGRPDAAAVCDARSEEIAREPAWDLAGAAGGTQEALADLGQRLPEPAAPHGRRAQNARRRSCGSVFVRLRHRMQPFVANGSNNVKS